MTRTERIPLRDRVLPDYTRSEEIMNMVTHIIGGAVGLLILIGSVLIGAKHRDPWAITSGSITPCIRTDANFIHAAIREHLLCAWP